MNLRRFVKEKYGIVTLTVLFVVCSAFIISHPHSFEDATVPDERSYYGWAKLYNEGIWHIPLYDWYGVQAGLDYHVNSTGLHYLRLQEIPMTGSGGARNLEVRVTMQDGAPVAGAAVRLTSQQAGLDVGGDTNATGAALFTNLPVAHMSVSAHYTRPRIGLDPAIDIGAFSPYDNTGIGDPYQARVEILDFSQLGSSYQMSLRVVDSLDDPVPGANISYLVRAAGQQPSLIGATDSDGVLSFETAQQGSQTVIAKKNPMRGLVQIASVVPYGGSYVAVNHWAPGYSVILGILDKARLADFAGILMMAMALVATYFLARRLFGWKVALVSAILQLTCGVALLLTWTSGMADYASMAFALVGIWLLVEIILKKRRWFVSLPVGFLGGAAFGVAVCIRYSTASLLLAIAFLILAFSYKDVKELRGRGKLVIPVARRLFERAMPFTVGLMVLLIPLAMYNSAYFGGPLGASHNYGGQISIDTANGNATANVVTGNVYSNFDPVDSIPTMMVRVHWLLTVMPFLLLIPAAVYMGWRRLSVLFLLAWVLSNLLLYLFVPWVASWWEAARALEDTRYFLPALPPAAILGGYAITDALLIPEKRRVLGLVVLSFLIIVGFAVAQAGIDAQMNRLNQPGGNLNPGGPPTPPTPPEENYTLLTVAQLLGGPGVYSDKLVEVRNCTFSNWTDAVSFLFRDASSPILLRVVLLGGYSPPALSPGAKFHVKGVFLWTDGNGDTIPQPPELRMTVKAGTTDSIVLA